LIDVILSLTRTSRVGYLRDIRRLTVALSRARLGLYILGRREIFENCFELKQAFNMLLARPDKLQLVTGELFPSHRILSDEEGMEEVPGQAQMENVEHLGKYVFDMTNSKVQQLRAEKGLPESALEPSMNPIEEGEEQVGYIEQGDADEGEVDLEEAVMQEGFEAQEDVVN
jgi:intron-binding protein aquarius